MSVRKCSIVFALSLFAVSDATVAVDLADNRLFTTPEQRAKLDALRHAPPPKPIVKKPEPVVEIKKPAAKPKPLPRVEVKGVVIRSGGPATAWVNDGSTLEGARIEGGIRVQASSDGEARVTLPDRRAVAVKPGEVYNPNNGRTTGIQIRRSP